MKIKLIMLIFIFAINNPVIIFSLNQTVMDNDFTSLGQGKDTNVTELAKHEKDKPLLKSYDAIAYTTPEEPDAFPTNQDNNYPSNKDGIYGFVLQLTDGKDPQFARPRSKDIYYFRKEGQDIIFSNVTIPILNNEKNLPPDITSIFKGPEGLYYFIREDVYCRRPLNVSGIGLDPPDYCPEGNNIRELLGCNLHSYPPEVDDLCNNPRLDHTFMAPNKKVAWLLRGKDVWLLHNLPSNPKATPSSCNITKHGDATKIWKGLNPKADALFVIEEDNEEPMLVQFYRHKYTYWNFQGGKPQKEGFIKEMPLKETQNSDQLSTEKPPEEAPITKTKDRPKNKIVYKEKEFQKLCAHPDIESADASLDGTKVYLFKNDVYYQLAGIKEKGFGKLTKFGQASEFLKKFQKTSSAIMTCKEGRNRGFVYQFTTTYGRKNHTYFTNWDINGKTSTFNEEWIEPSSVGLTAAFHNRNVTDPTMIALRGDEVFYFSTATDTFATKLRMIKHYDSREKLPPGVTAAFSMPDSIIYLFRDKHYCVRDMYYNGNPPYCPEWRDSRELFGCYGNPHRPTPKPRKKINDFKAMDDLCSDLNIDDADRTWQREDMIFVWRKDKFWRLADFPKGPRVVESGLSATKWKGFTDSPDAVTIIQEGIWRRGWFYAMNGKYWSSWYPDNKPLIGWIFRNRAWWGQPLKSNKFGAMMHNGDIKNPLVLGFDEQEVRNCFKNDCNQSLLSENWPSNITAAFRMEDNTVYLFRGDTYCHRKWNCSEKVHSCCKKWQDAKKLFKCHSFDKYSIDESDAKDQDYNENAGEE